MEATKLLPPCFYTCTIPFVMSRSSKYYSDSRAEWSSPGYASEYLEIAESVPHRNEGEQVLLEYIPTNAKRILDLGTGDGRLIKLIRSKRQQQSPKFIVVDVSAAMLEKATSNFKNDNNVSIKEHDLSYPISDKLTTEEARQSEIQFDAIVSGLAIHHLNHERKYSVYNEIYDLLEPGGVFCNLDHVASSS